MSEWHLHTLHVVRVERRQQRCAFQNLIVAGHGGGLFAQLCVWRHGIVPLFGVGEYIL
jgi:hypothetical protein